MLCEPRPVHRCSLYSATLTSCVLKLDADQLAGSACGATTARLLVGQRPKFNFNFLALRVAPKLIFTSEPIIEPLIMILKLARRLECKLAAALLN